jgi:hypothetical protein
MIRMAEQFVIMELEIDHGQTYLMVEKEIFGTLEDAVKYKNDHAAEFQDEGHAWTGRTEYEIVKKVGNYYFTLGGNPYQASDYFYGHLGQIQPRIFPKK